MIKNSSSGNWKPLSRHMSSTLIEQGAPFGTDDSPAAHQPTLSTVFLFRGCIRKGEAYGLARAGRATRCQAYLESRPGFARMHNRLLTEAYTIDKVLQRQE